MQSKTHNLWATPVWEIDLSISLDQVLQDIKLGLPNLNFDERHDVWDIVDPAFKKTLHEIILNEISTYFQNYDVSIEIRDGWFNKQCPGERIPVHNHNATNLVAILYLQAEDNCGDLVLIDSRGGVNWGWEKQGKYTGTKSTKFTPKVGKLLLVPAYVVHFVEENNSTTDRLSLVADLAMTIKEKIK